MVLISAGSKLSRDMFSKYMKLGYVETQIGKLLVYGASGTGKSSFIDMMVGNSPQPVRKSTPLAARPVAVFQLGVDGKKKWVKMSEKQRKEILIKALMSVQSQGEDSGSEGEDSGSEGEDLQGKEVGYYESFRGVKATLFFCQREHFIPVQSYQ